MKKPTPYLDVFRAQFGRAHKISREQLQTLLVTLSERASLDLRGHAVWYGIMDTAPIDTIAMAMANCPCDITFLSLGGRGHVRDIQYDQPGSMNPMQRAEISFVSVDLARDRECNSLEYLRRHAARVVIVTGDKIIPPKPPPAPPRKAPYYCETCGDEMMAIDRGKDTVCPVCAAKIGEWFL